MTKFEKSPPELIAFFQAIFAEFPQASLRKTFGYPCAYINNRMAAGLFENSLFLHLSPEDETIFLSIPGATSFAPMRNRPMRGYVIVPESVKTSNDLLNNWISKALEFTANLPAKKKSTLNKRV